MKRIFTLVVTTLLIIGSSWVSAYAQQDNNALFEGDLFYYSMVNSNEYVKKASKGMNNNGKKHTMYTIKGDKILFKDQSYHYSILLDPAANKVIFYFDLLQKGVQVSYDEYKRLYGSSYSKEGAQVFGNAHIAPTVYRLEPTGDTIHFKGQTAIKTKGHIEFPTTVLDLDAYTIPLNISKKFYEVELSGLDIDGLMIKFSLVSESKSSQLSTSTESQAAMDKQVDAIASEVIPGGLSKFAKRAIKRTQKRNSQKYQNIHEEAMKRTNARGDSLMKTLGIDMSFEEYTKMNAKIYTGCDLKDIVYRSVDDSEFNLSGDIPVLSIMSGGAVRLSQLHAENATYLKEHNMMPEQLTEEVVYDIDEEWEY